MREITGIIYQATNTINGSKYVGKSFRTKQVTENYLMTKRKAGHKYLMNHAKDKQYFHRALCKYGFENFEWKIIDRSNKEQELSEKETYWIKKLNTFAPNRKGYNSTLGGDGASGLPASEKSKRATRERSEVPIIEITTNKRFGSLRDAIAYFGGLSYTAISNVINNVDGCVQTKGFSFAKIAGYESNKEYYINLANDLNSGYISNQGGRAIVNITTGEVFISTKQASEKYNIDRSSISKVCKGRRLKQCGGFEWKYLKEYDNTEVN